MTIAQKFVPVELWVPFFNAIQFVLGVSINCCWRISVQFTIHATDLFQRARQAIENRRRQEGKT